jgi:hypothetical protein
MTSTHEIEPRLGAADQALTAEELRNIDAYWRACNYLCAGMIYLRDTLCSGSRFSPNTSKTGYSDIGAPIRARLSRGSTSTESFVSTT